MEQALMLRDKGHLVNVMHPHLNGNFLQTINGIKVEIGKIDNGKFSYYSIGRNVWIPGVKQHYFRALQKYSARWFEQYCKENGKPDVIHSHSAFLGGIVAAYISDKF